MTRRLLTTLKLFAVAVYWMLSLRWIAALMTYPDDLAFYGGLLWLTLNLFLTINLKKQLLK